MMKMVNVYLCMHIPDATYGMGIFTSRHFHECSTTAIFPHNTGAKQSIHGASGYVYMVTFIIYTWNLQQSSILRVVCPPKQGLFFPTKTKVIKGFQDIHVSSVTWLSFPGADKLLIRLCKDSKACSGSRPLGISEDAGGGALPLCFNGFQLGL